MDNYIGNTIQFDNNNISSTQQSPNMFNMNNNGQSTTLFNQPSNLPSNLASNLASNLPSNIFGGNYGSQSSNPNMSIDPILLNGTNLDDTSNFNSGFNSGFNSTQSNRIVPDPKLIKSVAREIINGLKENNMSLYDNSSLNSYKNKTNNIDDCDEDENENDDNYSSQLNKSKKSSRSNKNKIKEVVDKLEDFVIDNEISSTKSYSEYAGWFFDECFNYKDFLVLFIVYFILSQEMIKDFFAKYFSSLNPDYEGKIGVQGVIIYGLILTVLFMVVRKLF